MCTILANHLEDLACPVKVWLGKLTMLDMTPFGRKASTQKQNKYPPSYLELVIVTSLFYLEYILHVHSIKRSLYQFLLTRLD